MTVTAVRIPGAAGHELAGRIELPADGEPLAWALIAHCFTCSKESSAAVRIARALAERRIAVVRFDFTGLGESEGEFATHGFGADVADIQAVAAWMTREHAAPSILIGHSLGGTAILAAAAGTEGTRAVVTIGAPFDPEHTARLFEGAHGELMAGGRAEVTIGGRTFEVSRELVEELRAARIDEAVRGLRCPLLVMHSPLDEVVSIDHAASIYTAARHPKSFVSLDDADHLLTRPADAEYAAHVITAWATRYIDAPEPAHTVEEARRENRVSVTIGRERFRTEVLARGHGFVADEPSAVGGTDQGPTPYDLLGAALGTCTAMTLRMYADHKKWPLDAVRVLVQHDRVHAEDDAVDGDPGRLDRLTRDITVTGDLTDEQRARLVEIAERCPVHRTLEAGVRIETRG